MWKFKPGKFALKMTNVVVSVTIKLTMEPVPLSLCMEFQPSLPVLKLSQGLDVG